MEFPFAEVLALLLKRGELLIIKVSWLG